MQIFMLKIKHFSFSYTGTGPDLYVGILVRTCSMEPRTLKTCCTPKIHPKPNAVNPSPQWCFRWNLIMIGPLFLEIFMSESVNGRMDGWTPARVPSDKLTESLRLRWANKSALWSKCTHLNIKHWMLLGFRAVTCSSFHSEVDCHAIMYINSTLIQILWERSIILIIFAFQYSLAVCLAILVRYLGKDSTRLLLLSEDISLESRLIDLGKTYQMI